MVEWYFPLLYSLAIMMNAEYTECCYPVSFVLSVVILSIQIVVMLSVVYAVWCYSEYAECCYVECHLWWVLLLWVCRVLLCWVSFVLSAITLSIQRVVMLSAIWTACCYSEYAKCCFVECHYSEYAECCYAVCHFAECRGPSIDCWARNCTSEKRNSNTNDMLCTLMFATDRSRVLVNGALAYQQQQTKKYRKGQLSEVL